jgi:DNA-binding MarR family transcriptional regulator
MDVEPLRDAPLGRLVAMAGHLATRRWSQYLAEAHGLTPAGMVVLLELAKDGELSHRELADRCMVRPATLTGVIDTVEKAGYVERRRAGSDRRRLLLSLTGSGLVRAKLVDELISQRRALTSVDADPANEAVIRQFLLEFIELIGTEEEDKP